MPMHCLVNLLTKLKTQLTVLMTQCLLEQQQLNHTPIKASDIQRKTSADSVLSKVYNFIVCGWTRIDCRAYYLFV